MTFKPLYFLCFAVLLSGCGLLDRWFEKDENQPHQFEELDINKVAYDVSFEANLPGFVLERLKKKSELIEYQKRPPTSAIALIRRIKKDQKIHEQVLDSLGFFDGSVDYETKTDKLDDQEITHIIFKIDLKERYLLRDVSWICTKTDWDLPPIKDIKSLVGLKKTQYIDLEKLQLACEKWRFYLAKKGFPYATVTIKEGIIDRTEKKLDVVFIIDPGPKTRLSKITFSGFKDVHPAFIKRRAPLKKGELYNESKIEKIRKKLVNTQLFSGIEFVTTPPTKEQLSQETYETPVEVKIQEAPFRVIGGGVRYGTSEGPSLKAFWKHFNVKGQGETLSTSLKLGKKQTRLKASYLIPDFLKKEQELQYELIANKEHTRAYYEKTLEAEIMLKKPLSKTLDLNFGLLAETGKIEKETRYYTNQLLGLKLSVEIDTTDDLMDPKEGYRLTPTLKPYIGKAGAQNSLVQTTLDFSAYKGFLEDDELVLAFWGRLGTVLIGKLHDLSPNKRFYAGGGNSVRSYGYQMLGPLDELRNPIGGKSLTEGGIEARYRASEKIGLVAFFEGAKVSFKHALSIKGNKPLYGVGAGIRYYTDIGPIRFDVAFPLKRRKLQGDKKPIDSLLQLYFSIGQAF